MVGRRLAPLTVTVREGVITYPVYRLPLGEFSVDAEGSIDLVRNTIDVVTWLPFGALTDEAAGRLKINSGIGGALGQVLNLESLTMVPFRTSGSLDRPGTQVDVELMLKRLPGRLDPRDAPETIGNILRDVIKRDKK